MVSTWVLVPREAAHGLADGHVPERTPQGTSAINRAFNELPGLESVVAWF